MGGDFRQVGGDFLAKALDPEGPPPAQKTLQIQVQRTYNVILRRALEVTVKIVDTHAR